MTTRTPELEPDATAAARASTVAPGYCSEHPDHYLVSPRRAGMRTGYWPGERDDLAIICLEASHTLEDRERCRYCGGRLIPEGTPAWHVSHRRAFCSDLHRNYAFRVAQRAARDKARAEAAAAAAAAAAKLQRRRDRRTVAKTAARP